MQYCLFGFRLFLEHHHRSTSDTSTAADKSRHIPTATTAEKKQNFYARSQS